MTTPRNLVRAFHGGLSFTPGLDGQIHHRNRWQEVPPLRSLTQQQWDEICTSEDWFVFGVLRDPRLRLFSAWQDKYLLRHPGYWSEWSTIDRPLPTTPEQEAQGFAEFCATLAADAQHPALRDGHFGTQVHALRPALVPYRRLYDMSGLGTLMADLNGHLVAQGHACGLTLARTNSSPFKPCGLLFAHAHALVEVHERLSEVVRLGRVKRRREARLRRRVARLDRRLKAGEPPAASPRSGPDRAPERSPAAGVGGRPVCAPRGHAPRRPAGAGSRVTRRG